MTYTKREIEIVPWARVELPNRAVYYGPVWQDGKVTYIYYRNQRVQVDPTGKERDFLPVWKLIK